MKLLQSFYGNGMEVYVKEVSIQQSDVLSISIKDVIQKMEAKESDIVSIMMQDDDSQNIIIISNNESLAKKMDINFNKDDKNLSLFEEDLNSNVISDLIDSRYFENTKFINVEGKNYFSFHCMGKASQKVSEFIEAFVEDQSFEIQKKNRVKY